MTPFPDDASRRAWLARAARLGLATGTASHHLTTLRDAGLAAADRAGRRLLYQRTPLGDQLTDG